MRGREIHYSHSTNSNTVSPSPSGLSSIKKYAIIKKVTSTNIPMKAKIEDMDTLKLPKI